MNNSKTSSKHKLKQPKEVTYVRFTPPQRIAHFLLVLSFTTLAITGLPQKFSNTPAGEVFIGVFGGIEQIRLIHHIAAIILALVSFFHIIDVLYRVIVIRRPLYMLPVVEDFIHLLQDLGYYFGFRKHKAFYGRYNYAEKMEYLAVVWGTIIMGLSGYMMWNPIATTQLFPGEFIPASKAAHGGEAILAVLSIFLWHFYHVHLRHFNKSMFIGTFTRKEMEEEHPGELLQIESGVNPQMPSQAQFSKRKRIFYPIAGVLSIIFAVGSFLFFSYEKTAIATVPRGETVQVFVQITPTPRPTPTPLPVIQPGQVISGNTWAGGYEALLRNRCKNCHGVTSVGGLSFATYESALAGGKSGPAIVPGNPDASILVQIQTAGNHPGQLTLEELNQLIAWILAGAPQY